MLAKVRATKLMDLKAEKYSGSSIFLQFVIVANPVNWYENMCNEYHYKPH